MSWRKFSNLTIRAIRPGMEGSVPDRDQTSDLRVLTNEDVSVKTRPE